MKKQWKLLALLLALLLLCACSAGTPKDGEDSDQQGGGQVPPMSGDEGQTQGSGLAGLPENYDPASEEDDGTFHVDAVYDANGNIVYAGATPVHIDPIDMPTATPRPELTFEYGEYTAANLGLKFSAAVGYSINDSASNIYILTEPEAAVKDNHACVITLELTQVEANYGASNIRSDLAAYLEREGSQYTTWETAKAASRKLLDGTGYYNDYRGVQTDGTIVRGRVHMALIGDNQLLTIHISAPGWYNTSYMNIYTKIRETLARVQ